MGTAVSRWSMLCFAALRKQKSSSWKVLLPRLVKYSCIVFEEIVFTLPKCHEWLSGLEIMLRWISWLQPAIGMVFMCSNFPARQCGFVWVCIQNDECDRGWRWLNQVDYATVAWYGFIWALILSELILATCIIILYMESFTHLCLFEFMATWSPAKRSGLETYRWQAQKAEGRIFSSHLQRYVAMITQKLAAQVLQYKLTLQNT